MHSAHSANDAVARLVYDFFAGTFFPSLRASDRPIAIACFRLVTFLPLRPDFSLPFFLSRISVSTFFPADGEYLRLDDFFEADFLALDFLELDLFLAAFFVAITILLGGQMAPLLEQVVWRCPRFN